MSHGYYAWEACRVALSSGYLRRRMRCLAGNLAVAGALCEAFEAGEIYHWTEEGEPVWRPNRHGLPWRRDRR